MPIVDVPGDLATPMQPVRIRPATSADIKRLKALLDASWQTHWAPHVLPASVARYMSERPAHGYVDAHWQRFMVAEREDGVLGMYDLEGEYLHAIHVHPDAIGSGVGRALMDHAEEQGARTLDVRVFNSRAIEFYEQRGWKAIRKVLATEMGTPTQSLIMHKAGQPE